MSLKGSLGRWPLLSSALWAPSCGAQPVRRCTAGPYSDLGEIFDNYGNDDFESGFQGATGLTMRFRQPQAHGATAHGYGARIRRMYRLFSVNFCVGATKAHGYGARKRRTDTMDLQAFFL